MANSGTVTAGSAALASQYNNLRLDVLDVTTGHTHAGTTNEGAKVAATGVSSGTAANGAVLTADGSGAAAFLALNAGGMTLISTATPSAATSLSFTSIPTTYKHLVIMWVDVQQSAAEYWNIRCNNDTTASFHLTSNNLGSITGTTFGDSQASFSMISTPANPAAYYRAAGSLTFWRYTDTSVKSMNGIRTYYASADQLSNAVSGRYLGTSAITRLDFIRTSTQTITGNFYLYGVS
jgi:hypothetical protein